MNHNQTIPKISIITPIFNNSELIKETIKSVINQTYTNWEMIIVDDGSDKKYFDKVEQFVSKFEKIKLIKRDRLPKGPSTCRNIGAELATGKYLIFLDSDDILADFCLKERLEIMENDENLNFAVFNQALFQNKINDLNVIFNQYATSKINYLRLFLENKNPWQTMAPIWRKGFFFKINGFNESYLFMEDPELHTRALLQKDVFFLIEKKGNPPDSFYRQGSWNEEKTDTFWQNSIIYRIKYLKEMYQLINKQEIVDKNKLINSLNKFLYNLVRNFMIVRIKLFQKEYFNLIFWANKKNIISKMDYLKLYILGSIWLVESKIMNMLKLKGIAYKLLSK